MRPVLRRRHTPPTAVLLNRSALQTVIAVSWRAIGLRGSVRVRDLWTHTDIGAMTDRFSATVPAHGVVMVRITPIAGGAETGGAKEDE